MRKTLARRALPETLSSGTLDAEDNNSGLEGQGTYLVKILENGERKISTYYRLLRSGEKTMKSLPLEEW